MMTPTYTLKRPRYLTKRDYRRIYFKDTDRRNPRHPKGLLVSLKRDIKYDTFNRKQRKHNKIDLYDAYYQYLEEELQDAYIQDFDYCESHDNYEEWLDDQQEGEWDYIYNDYDWDDAFCDTYYSWLNL